MIKLRFDGVDIMTAHREIFLLMVSATANAAGWAATFPNYDERDR